MECLASFQFESTREYPTQWSGAGGGGDPLDRQTTSRFRWPGRVGSFWAPSSGVISLLLNEPALILGKRGDPNEGGHVDQLWPAKVVVAPKAMQRFLDC